MKKAVATLYTVSPQLQTIINISETTRGEAVKQFWVYAKSKSLQDPSNGRIIRSDTRLKKVFETDTIAFHQVAKYISPHLTKKET